MPLPPDRQRYRACHVAGDAGATSEWKARALDALGAITDPEDRTIIEGDIATLP